MTMVVTHTPGPWHVGPHYKSDVESSQGRICECGITQGPQAEANAHLIAAAPELLEACRNAIAWVALSAANNPDSHPRAIENAKADLAAIKAAIAKAEGT